MVLIIDNYDSFTYNLFQFVGKFEKNVLVKKNDEITIDEIEKINPSHIIISPGGGKPKDAGVSEKVITMFGKNKNILGVCLGHQAIAEVYGAKIDYAKELYHGKTSDIYIASGSPLFVGLAPIERVARYHSLIVKRDTIGEKLLVIAETDEGDVMAIKHRDYNVYGIQFHPESILTKNGETIIKNFLEMEVEA